MGLVFAGCQLVLNHHEHSKTLTSMTNQDIPGTGQDSPGTQQDSSGEQPGTRQDSPGTEEDSPEAGQNQTPLEKSHAYNTTTDSSQDPW